MAAGHPAVREWLAACEVDFLPIGYSLAEYDRMQAEGIARLLGICGGRPHCGLSGRVASLAHVAGRTRPLTKVDQP